MYFIQSSIPNPDAIASPNTSSRQTLVSTCQVPHHKCTQAYDSEQKKNNVGYQYFLKISYSNVILIWHFHLHPTLLPLISTFKSLSKNAASHDKSQIDSITAKSRNSLNGAELAQDTLKHCSGRCAGPFIALLSSPFRLLTKYVEIRNG